MSLFVQSSSGDIGGGNVTNWQPFVATQPVAGHGLIIGVTLQQNAGGTGVSLAVSDNQTGNSYTVVGQSPVDASGAPGVQVAYILCASLASVVGTYTLSITATNGTVYGVAIVETNAAMALDQSSLPAQVGTGTTGQTANCSAPNANADEIVLAVLCAHYESAAIGLATPTTSYTSLILQDPSAGASYSIAYKETSAIETSSATWAWTTAANYGYGLATFKSTSTIPTVSSVNGGSSIAEGATGVAFVGSNFASGLTCAIEQYLSGTLDATVTQANPVYTDVSDGKFDLTMEPAGTQLAFTDAIYTHKLKVTVGANSGDGSIAGGLTPPAGLIFKTLTSYNSGSAYVITASGTLVVNDQLEASGNATGTAAAPAGLSINADGTWSYANGYAVQNFYVRAYDSTTQTWGAWALQSTSASPTSVLYKNVYVVNTTGLVQWVHYIPIKYVTVTATEVNRFDDNGAIGVNVLTSVTGLTAWVDYTPVAVSAGTHPWRYDNDGYIPVMQMN